MYSSLHVYPLRLGTSFRSMATVFRTVISLLHAMAAMDVFVQSTCRSHGDPIDHGGRQIANGLSYAGGF
jgi:hypothetical protein